MKVKCVKNIPTNNNFETTQDTFDKQDIIQDPYFNAYLNSISQQDIYSSKVRILRLIYIIGLFLVDKIYLCA